METIAFQFEYQVFGLQNVVKNFLTVNRLNETLELRSQKEIELQVNELEKSTRIEIENNGYNLTRFDHFEHETLAE